LKYKRHDINMVKFILVFAMISTQIRAIFDRIAPVYDQLNDWSLGQHQDLEANGGEVE